MRCISQPRSKLLVLIATTIRNGYARNADPDPVPDRNSHRHGDPVTHRYRHSHGDPVPNRHSHGNTNTHSDSNRYASARHAVASARDSEPSQGDAYSTSRHSYTAHRTV